MKKSELRKIIMEELQELNLKKGATTDNQSSLEPETSDIKTLKTMISRNSSLLNRLKTVNNGKEINEFLAYVLSLINEKATGVNKSALIKTIYQKFK